MAYNWYYLWALCSASDALHEISCADFFDRYYLWALCSASDALHEISCADFFDLYNMGGPL